VPTLTRWFIKSAMLYLVAALILSIAMQSSLHGEVPFLLLVWPTYLHLLVVGWLTQLIFGVAFWLFPKHSAAHPRGSDLLGSTSPYPVSECSGRLKRRMPWRPVTLLE
jgi:hypothetical protein